MITKPPGGGSSRTRPSSPCDGAGDDEQAVGHVEGAHRPIAPQSRHRAARRAARRPTHAAPRASAGSPRQTFGITTSGSAAAAGSTRQRAVVVPQLEGAGLAQPLDASPAAAGHDLDVAVERDQALAVARLERVAASDAARPRAPDAPGRSAASSSWPTLTSRGPASRRANAGWAPAMRRRPATRPRRTDAGERRRVRRASGDGHRQPAGRSARSTTRAAARADEVGRPRARRPRPAGPRPPTRRSCGSRSRSTRIVVAGRVAERRDAADRESGRGARLVAVGASRARRAGGASPACPGRPGWRRRRGRRPGDRRP